MLIQNQRAAGNLAKRWDKTGIVVECKGNDKYSIRVDGSGRITDRNRRYLRASRPGTNVPTMPTDRPTPLTTITPASAAPRTSPTPPETPSLAMSKEIGRSGMRADPVHVLPDNPPHIPEHGPAAHIPEHAPAGPVQSPKLTGRETISPPSQPGCTEQTPTYPEVVGRPARIKKLPERFRDYDMNSVNQRSKKGVGEVCKS